LGTDEDDKAANVSFAAFLYPLEPLVFLLLLPLKVSQAS
jgi:hypothetical protein